MRRNRRGDAYHVERDNMLEGDISSLVTLDEDLVDQLGAATGWEAKDKWLLRGWSKCLDTTYSEYC